MTSFGASFFAGVLPVRRMIAAFLTGAFLTVTRRFLIAGFAAAVPGVPASTLTSAVPIGEPRPVQASQPGPALNAPLLPTVMSLKADFALAA